MRTTDTANIANKVYTNLVDKGSDLVVGRIETRIRKIVSIAPSTPPTVEVGNISSVITVKMRPKNQSVAMKFDADVSEYVNKATGTPVAFLTNVTGFNAELTWVAVFADAAALDKGLDWEATDAGCLERVGGAVAADAFIEGSGHRGFLTKIA